MESLKDNKYSTLINTYKSKGHSWQSIEVNLASNPKALEAYISNEFLQDDVKSSIQHRQFNQPIPKNYISNPLIDADRFAPAEEVLDTSLKGQYVSFAQISKPEDFKYFVINETGAEMTSAFKTFMEAEAVGFDAEWCFDDERKEIQILQMACDKLAVVFDAYALRYCSEFKILLASVMEHPNVLKISYGEDDIDKLNEWIFREMMPITINNYCDYSKIFTKRYSNSFNKSNLTFKVVVESLLNKKFSKVEQISDWGRRPLRQTQLHYAAMDAYFLIFIYKEFKNGDIVIEINDPSSIEAEPNGTIEDESIFSLLNENIYNKSVYVSEKYLASVFSTLEKEDIVGVNAQWRINTRDMTLYGARVLTIATSLRVYLFNLDFFGGKHEFRKLFSAFLLNSKIIKLFHKNIHENIYMLGLALEGEDCLEVNSYVNLAMVFKELEIVEGVLHTNQIIERLWKKNYPRTKNCDLAGVLDPMRMKIAVLDAGILLELYKYLCKKKSFSLKNFIKNKSAQNAPSSNKSKIQFDGKPDGPDVRTFKFAKFRFPTQTIIFDSGIIDLKILDKLGNRVGLGVYPKDTLVLIGKYHQVFINCINIQNGNELWDFIFRQNLEKVIFDLQTFISKFKEIKPQDQILSSFIKVKNNAIFDNFLDFFPTELLTGDVKGLEAFDFANLYHEDKTILSFVPNLILHVYEIYLKSLEFVEYKTFNFDPKSNLFDLKASNDNKRAYSTILKSKIITLSLEVELTTQVPKNMIIFCFPDIFIFDLESFLGHKEFKDFLDELLTTPKPLKIIHNDFPNIFKIISETTKTKSVLDIKRSLDLKKTTLEDLVFNIKKKKIDTRRKNIKSEILKCLGLGEIFQYIAEKHQDWLPSFVQDLLKKK